ncbi:MAG: general secretion pathway protein GspK [Candidatus Schekmanbacteria bacterium]|nr:general secretion pathway protein GspK [Candidatus Schekmanbacteria bacterium]
MKTAGKRERGCAAPGERGVALMMVLWVMVLLAVIAGEFSFSTRNETNAVRNSRDLLQAQLNAMAGFQAAIAEISAPFAFNYLDTNGKLAFASQDLGRAADAATGRDNPGGPTKSGPPGNPAEVPAAQQQLPVAPQRIGVPYHGGSYSYVIVDEDSRFNLNSMVRRDEATQGESRSPYQFFRELLMRTGVPGGVALDEISDSIIDWRDLDDFRQANGAETDWYEANYRDKGFLHPYKAKNSKFDTVSELLLVRGVTAQVLFGSAALPPGLALLQRIQERIGGKQGASSAAASLPAWFLAGQDGEYSGITQYVTVWGFSGSTQVRLNKNTASPLLIELAYPEKTTEIMSARASQGYYQVSERSSYFTVTSEGRHGDARYRLAATVRKMGSSARALLHVQALLPDAPWPKDPYGAADAPDLVVSE